MQKVSIIICTHNRCESLPETIESLLFQTYKDFELIVVDNASQDKTKKVVESYHDKITNIIYIYEGTIGLSVARNSGLSKAKGEIVAFIDDDELTSEKWLESIVDSFRGNDKVVAVGGRMELKWLEPRPDWLPEILDYRLGKLDMGDQVCRMVFPKYPFGGNMSFKREFLQELGGFSANLGLKGNKRFANEEKEIFSKINKMGDDYVVLYNPGALVCHKVDPKILKPEYFVTRQYLQGISDIIVREGQEDPSPTRTRWILRALNALYQQLIYVFGCLIGLISFNKSKILLDYMNVAYWLGYAKECFRIAIIGKKI